MADRVRQQGRQSVDALARAFDVSAETVRRDLSVLAEDGRVRKVHGAALRPKLRTEPSFVERATEDMAAKRSIANTVRQLIEPGETLFLDTGSTTLKVAEALAPLADITVVTNSSPIAECLSNGNAASIVLLGGYYRRGNAQTIGPHTIEQIGRFRADRAILTVAALDNEGAMDSDFDEAQVARAMRARSRETLVVASAKKFNRQAAHAVCHLSDIDTLVLDKPPDASLGRALDSAGVNVHVAQPLAAVDGFA